VIVVDTSIWIDFLRRSDTAGARALTILLEEESDIATTEIVAMELLAGLHEREIDEVRRFLYGFPMLPLLGKSDFEDAAGLYRRCRDAGETVRELSDCLVAVPAIRAGAPVLHSDADFDRLARHTHLEVLSLSA
jgi:predicted nucleic acid-binding protein